MRQDGVGRVKKIFRYERLLYFMIAIFIPLSFFSGCATGEKGYYVCLDFDTRHDSPEVEVLDYHYGECNHYGICANRRRVANGESFDKTCWCGSYARGKTLYVKWLVKETGTIYEDTVDLDKRMPRDVNLYLIRFVIRYDQLFVYLVPPPGDWPAIALKDPITEGKSAWTRKFIIYPDHPTTYPDRIIE